MPSPRKTRPKSDFDMKTAQARGMTRDAASHLPSRDPVTGKILKSRTHPTFRKAIAADLRLGFKPFENNKTGNIHTFKRNPNPGLFTAIPTSKLLGKKGGS